MTPSANESPVLSFGPYTLDPANARLARDGEPVELAPKDLDVLVFLARRAGRLVSKNELLDGVWQHRFVSESVLKTVVSRLRGVLGDDARQPRYIETASRRGYRFIADVAAAPQSAVLPEDDRPAAAPAHRLVGRDAALAQLRREFDGLVAGKVRVVLVAGEAGIGKSSLIEHFVQTASASTRPRVAFGQCVEHTGAVEPYLPVLEALGELCRAPSDPAPLVALMRRVAPTWLVQMPWHVTADDRVRLQQEVAGATQDRMLREFAELLDQLTAVQPLLLVIEDLHWSDHATVQLIGYLARRRGNAQVLLLGSLRPADLIVDEHPLKRLRQELRQQRLCVEIALELFSETDAGAYLTQRIGSAAWSEAAVRALHEHTGGLPLFVAAVVDELGAQGPTGDGEPSPQPQLQLVPRSIFGLIEQQWARLPVAMQRWLEAASVAGVEFEHATLADALRVDPGDLQAGLDVQARSRRWLLAIGPVELPGGRVATRYAFRHAVYRNVLYELAGEAQRLQWHRQFAAALLRTHAAEVEPIAAEVAVHFEKGQELPNAVRHLAIAANLGLRRFAAAEAAAIAQRALALLDRIADRQTLRDTEVALLVVIGVAMTELKGLGSDEAMAAFDRTRPLMDGLRDTTARVPAMHGIWWATLVRGDMHAARELATRTLALADKRNDEPLHFAGNAALGITLTHIGEMAVAERHLLLALEHRGGADSSLPPAMFSFEPGVQLLSYLAVSLWAQGRPSDARRRMALARARAQDRGHPMTRVLALNVDATLCAMGDDHAGARAIIEQALQLIQEQRLERATGSFRWMLGSALAALGEVETGLEMMLEGRRLQLEHGLGYGLTRWHLNYASACLAAGRVDAAMDAADEGCALALQTGERAVSSELLRLRAEVLQRHGRSDEAAAVCLEAITLARQQHALCAEIDARLGWCRLPGIAPTHAAAELDAVLARWTDPWVLAPVREARALRAALQP